MPSRPSSALFRTCYRNGEVERVELAGGFGMGAGGATKAALTGAQFLGQCHGDDRGWLADELPRRLEEQGEAEFSFRIVADDASVVWYRAWERVVERADGCLVAERFVTDITAEKQAQQDLAAKCSQLEEKSQAFEAMVANLPGCLFRLHYAADGTKRILFVDGGIARAVSGLREMWTTASPEELVKYYHPDDREALFNRLPQELKETGFVVHTFRVMFPGGGIRWWRAWEKVTARMGAEMITEGLVIDVSEEMEAKQQVEASQEALEQTARTLEAVVVNLPGNVFRLHYGADGKRRALFIDGGMARSTPGLKELLETASADDFMALYHPDDHDFLINQLPRQLRETGFAVHTFRYAPAEGDVRWWRAWEKVVQRDGDEMITEGVVIDVTDEMMANQMLESLVANLPGIVFRYRYPAHGPKKPLFLDGTVIRQFRAQGLDPMNMPEQDWINLFPVEDQHWLFVEIPEQLRREGQIEFLNRYYEPDGTLGWNRVWEKVVASDGDGFITEGLCINRTAEVQAKQALEAREAELRQANERLEALVGNLPGNVFRMHYDANDDKRTLFVDGGLIRSTPGLKEWMESLSPEEFRNAFLPEERDALFVEVPRRLREKGISVHTFRHAFPGGDVCWLRAYEKVISRDGDQMVTDGIVLDVTDEVQASRMLDSIVANLPGMVFRFHYPASGLKKLTFMDGAELRQSGRFLGDDYVAMSPEAYSQLFDPDTRQWLYGELPRILRQKGEATFTQRFSNADGSVRWARVWEKVVWRNGDEMITEGMSLDVTDQLVAKLALEDSERLYRELVSLTAVGVVNIDGAGRCTYVNDRFLEMVGTSREEFLALNWLGFVHPEDAERQEMQWRAAMAAHTAQRAEFRVVNRRDGNSLWVLGQTTPHVAANGAVVGWVVTVTDITDRYLREDMERQLGQAAKMEALGQLAGSVAHDFNNLLGAVLGFAGFIAEDTPPGSSSHHHAGRIIAAGTRGKALVEQILAFARREDDTRENVFLAELVREIQTLLAISMPSNARMTISASDNSAVVSGDRNRLGQVLMNLCINARDALDGRSGEVNISVRPPRATGPAFARLSRRPPGVAVDMAEVWSEGGASYAIVGAFDAAVPHVSLAVSDTGSGMGLGVLENIFKPFFTTKERGKGTGLGLPMVSSAVLAHDGAIVVETREQHGTTFEIVLPVVSSADQPVVPAAAAVAAPAIRLLLVDNDTDFGDMLGYGLKRRGFHVTTHSDPRQALAALRSCPDGWDGLISDLVMTPVSGVDLVCEAQAIRRDLPCVICTGYPDDHVDVRRLSEMGVSALLRKTMDVSEIVRAIVQAVGGEDEPAAGA